MRWSVPAILLAGAMTVHAPDGRGQSCTDLSGCNVLRVRQVGDDLTLAVVQIGNSNRTDLNLRATTAQRLGSGAAALGQVGFANAIDVDLAEPPGAAAFDVLLALEQEGDGNSTVLQGRAETFLIGLSQIGSGNTFALEASVDRLDFHGRQSGATGSMADIAASFGTIDIRFNQSGGGGHRASLHLENPGGGPLTVDWAQTGTGDSQALALSCGNVSGCDLSYAD